MEFPFYYEEESEDIQLRRLKLFQSPHSVLRQNMLHIQPGDVVVPARFKEIDKEVFNFQPRPDDVWIVTFPKCGTTVTQEMVWQILHNIDIEGGQVPLGFRSPFLEFRMLAPEDVSFLPEKSRRAMLESVKLAKNLCSPRVIKTHMPLPMLPPKLLDTCKVVYVTRNPKDCCTSFYHHAKLLPFEGYTGSFTDFANLFKSGLVTWGDFWHHLGTAWKHKDHPNMIFSRFEDLKRDLQGTIRKTAEKLGRTLTQEQIDKLADHLHVDNFRKNKSVNTDHGSKDGEGSFIRKGIVGDWKSHFNESETVEWDKWIKENMQKWAIDKDLFEK